MSKMAHQSVQKGGKGQRLRPFITSVFLLPAFALGGCNIASHYESAANIGDSRAELTPLYKEAEDQAVSASKPVEERKRAVVHTASVKKATPVKKVESDTRTYSTTNSFAATSPTKATMEPLEPALPEVRTDNTRVQTGGTVEQKVSKRETLDKGLLALEEAFAKHNGNYRTTQQINDTISPRCKLVLANTGISTALLRSPTLSANVDSDENYGVGLSYDFVDLKRADLQEELALARCYQIAVSVKITQLLVTSSQSLTRSGYLAKANALRHVRGRLSGFRSQITEALRSGNLTETRAAILHQYIDQVKSSEAKARGEASKREIVDRLLKRQFKNLDNQLITAQRRIHDIQARIRTTDAVSLRGEVSYGGATDIGLNGSSHSSRDGELSGSVKVSVRLGAFSERRHQLEEVARMARVEGLYEADSGVLWRTKELARVNERGLEALYAVRKDIVSALRQAKRNTKRIPSAFVADLLMPRMRARIDILILNADLAGIDATIADTRRINAKLRFKQ